MRGTGREHREPFTRRRRAAGDMGGAACGAGCGSARWRAKRERTRAAVRGRASRGGVVQGGGCAEPWKGSEASLRAQRARGVERSGTLGPRGTSGAPRRGAEHCRAERANLCGRARGGLRCAVLKARAGPKGSHMRCAPWERLPSPASGGAGERDQARVSGRWPRGGAGEPGEQASAAGATSGSAAVLRRRQRPGGAGPVQRCGAERHRRAEAGKP